MAQTPPSVPGTLTDRRFWETEYYWGKLTGAIRPDLSSRFDRCLMRELGKRAPASATDTVLEVGCAPAKWLVYYAEQFGSQVNGIEYTAKGAQLSRDNLSACGLTGTIHEQDFFAMNGVAHDLVLSFGFLEHFDDLSGTFARHVDFVAPGGRLVLGVPNFRGINRAIQRIADPPYLARHNTRAMSAGLLRSFGDAAGLRLEHLGYFGSHDPALLRVDPHRSAWDLRGLASRAVIRLGQCWRILPFTERIDHRLASIYLLGVWQRPV